MFRLKGKNGDLYKIKCISDDYNDVVLFEFSAKEDPGTCIETDIHVKPGDIVLRIKATQCEIAIIHPLYGYKWVSNQELELLY